MSAETTTARKQQAAAPASVIRLVEVRIAKPWRLSRRASVARKTFAAAQGWALAAAILAAAPLPAAAQPLWFDPDISMDAAIWADAPSDDDAIDEAPACEKWVLPARASVTAPHHVA